MINPEQLARLMAANERIADLERKLAEARDKHIELVRDFDDGEADYKHQLAKAREVIKPFAELAAWGDLLPPKLDDFAPRKQVDERQPGEGQ